MGVRVVGFDMDGTLKNTRRLFNRQFEEAAGLLLYKERWEEEKASGNGVVEGAREYKERVLDKVLWSLRPEVGIRPYGGELMVRIAAGQLGLKAGSFWVEKAVDCIRTIYETAPDNFPGAVETVEKVNRSGVRTLLMTHAEIAWSQIKRRDGYTGLFEQLICFDIDRPKSVQWQEQLAGLGVEPGEFLMIGDDYHADIQGVIELDGRGVWIFDHYRPFCVESNYEEIRVCESVIMAKTIADVVPAILEGGSPTQSYRSFSQSLP